MTVHPFPLARVGSFAFPLESCLRLMLHCDLVHRASLHPADSIHFSSLAALRSEPIVCFVEATTVITYCTSIVTLSFYPFRYLLFSLLFLVLHRDRAHGRPSLPLYFVYQKSCTWIQPLPFGGGVCASQLFPQLPCVRLLLRAFAKTIRFIKDDSKAHSTMH